MIRQELLHGSEYNSMSAEKASHIATIIAAIIAAISLILSAFFSWSAWQEVLADRKQRDEQFQEQIKSQTQLLERQLYVAQQPYVFTKELFKELDLIEDDDGTFKIESKKGNLLSLINLGDGPAINVAVIWNGTWSNSNPSTLPPPPSFGGIQPISLKPLEEIEMSEIPMTNWEGEMVISYLDRNGNTYEEKGITAVSLDRSAKKLKVSIQPSRLPRYVSKTILD